MASALTLVVIGRWGGPAASAEGALRTVARAAFGPVESAGDTAFRPLRGAAAALRRGGDLARAEAGLAGARERARSEAARAEALEAENGRLAALLHLDGAAGGDGVAARVTSTGAGRSGGTLGLDRGGDDGIRVGMPVVAAGGLVGRVVEVSPRHSTVLPLVAATSAVGVRAGNAGAAGVVQGDGGSALRLDLLDPSAPLESGDLAVTSGLRHSLFPAGLPLGRVTGGRGRFLVHPFAPPDRLEVVKVLRWSPEG